MCRQFIFKILKRTSFYLLFFLFSFCSKGKTNLHYWLEKDSAKRNFWLNEQDQIYDSLKKEFQKKPSQNPIPKPKTLTKSINSYTFKICDRSIYYKNSSSFKLFTTIKKFIPRFIENNNSNYLIIYGSKYFNDDIIIQVWNITDKEKIFETKAINYPLPKSTENNLYFPNYTTRKFSTPTLFKFNFKNRITKKAKLKSLYSFNVIKGGILLSQKLNKYYLEEEKNSNPNVTTFLFKQDSLIYISKYKDLLVFYKNGDTNTNLYTYSLTKKHLKPIFEIKKAIDVIDVKIYKNDVYINFIHKGKSFLQSYNLDYKSSKRIIDNEVCTINLVSEKENLKVQISSFIQKSKVFNIDSIPVFTNRKYKTIQKWVKKDNDSIPIILFYKNTLKHSKLILSAYGGFGKTITPYYSENIIDFVNDGGIYCIAGIRGGGEMGNKWHREGMKLNKKNSFFDFEQCIDYIVNNKISSPKKIVILGSSNGGLLINHAINNYPEKFEVAISLKGLSDMVNYDKYNNGRFWINEYGNPNEKNTQQYLNEYSPLHNVKKRDDKTKILIVTGDKDDRVNPLHSYKFACELQKKGYKNVYLKKIKDCGHKISDYKLRELNSDIFNFIEYFLIEN